MQLVMGISPSPSTWIAFPTTLWASSRRVGVMAANKSTLDDVLSLSMQLNRQAFARPPVEGWLNSFMAMLYERFASANVKGIQIAQVIGDVALRMGSAGTVPNHASDQYALDDSSPIAAALK